MLNLNNNQAFQLRKTCDYRVANFGICQANDRLEPCRLVAFACALRMPHNSELGFWSGHMEIPVYLHTIMRRIAYRGVAGKAVGVQQYDADISLMNRIRNIAVDRFFVRTFQVQDGSGLSELVPQWNEWDVEICPGNLVQEGGGHNPRLVTKCWD